MYLKFQFHKGTIKTDKTFNKGYLALWFQFHKGTIKTLSGKYATVTVYNFNSIKVRLKRLLLQ